MPATTIELYGVLRMQAGVASIAVDARSAGEALELLEQTVPALRGRLLTGARELRPEHRIAVNGGAVTADLSQGLASGDHLVILSAQAGG